MKLNWNFLGVAGVQNKRPSVERVWIFSGTTQFKFSFILSLAKKKCNLVFEILLPTGAANNVPWVPI